MARNRINKGGSQPGEAQTADLEGQRSANNPNPRTAPNTNEETNTIVERAYDPLGENKLVPTPIRGGSYGVIPEAVQSIGIHVGRPKPREESIHQLPKKFVITGPIITSPNHPYAGKVTFMYDHMRVYVNPGKEVSQNMYDLALLRSQGVRLEEVIDPATEERDKEIRVPVAEDEFDDEVVAASLDKARAKAIADHNKMFDQNNTKTDVSGPKP